MFTKHFQLSLSVMHSCDISLERLHIVCVLYSLLWMAMACRTVSSPIKPSWPTTTTSCGMKQYFNRYKLSWISENTNMFQAQIMHRTKCKCKCKCKYKCKFKCKYKCKCKCKYKCKQDGLLCHKDKLVPDKKYFWQFHYFRQGELTIQKTLQLPIGLFPPV